MTEINELDSVRLKPDDTKFKAKQISDNLKLRENLRQKAEKDAFKVELDKIPNAKVLPRPD